MATVTLPRAAALALLAGLASRAWLAPAPALADDRCARALDGACDELAACALDTDTTDCRTLCVEPWSAPIAGACAHYAAIDLAARPAPPDTGSHGDGGLRGVWTDTITARGRAAGSEIVRHYKVYVPAAYDPRVPTPLLYMLGGFTVDAYGLDAYTELMRTADLEGLIVAFPQQHYVDFGGSIGWVFAWSIYRTDWDTGAWEDNPEVDFIRRLTAELESRYNIDRSRIYASGHSRGAAMSVILAFELPDTIAGFWSEMGFVAPNGYDARMRERAPLLSRRPPGVMVHGSWDMDVDISESETIAATLTSLGWAEGDDFLFIRPERVAHEWQPQYNLPVWDFLSERSLPLETAP